MNPLTQKWHGYRYTIGEEAKMVEPMHYSDERFGFDGDAADIDGYFTRENFIDMFGECDLSDDDLDELRREAHADLDEEL